MMRLFALWALALIAMPAIAQTLAGNSSAVDTNAAGVNGQSFTVAGSGSFNYIVISFYAMDGSPTGVGNLYIFDSPYGGSPTGLASSSPLAAVAYNGSNYAFDPSLALNGGSIYYAYLEAAPAVPIGNSTSNPYAGGDRYYSSSSANPYTTASIPGRDLYFSVTGATTPEPASRAMLIGGFALTGASLRRTRRANRTARA